MALPRPYFSHFIAVKKGRLSFFFLFNYLSFALSTTQHYNLLVPPTLWEQDHLLLRVCLTTGMFP